MQKIVLYIAFIFVFLGCSSYDDLDRTPTFTNEINDTMNWYEDIDVDVSRLSITIPTPNSTGYTLADIDADTDPYDKHEPYLDVALSSDVFNSSKRINATFEQKGKSTRNGVQKSYRIWLNDDEPMLNSEYVFQLGKHPFDKTRLKNKLSFDLIKDIPHVPSLKTEFIHLDINGTDYGLFTHVEYVDEQYLRNRGWSEEDNLFKAQEFYFEYNSSLALGGDDKPLNLEAFERMIEKKSGKNYDTLLEMVHAVNSNDNFEKVFNTYFNRDNYITWMAINLVLVNRDTTTQNYYLYNPKHSKKFYFIPWDYDGIAREVYKYGKWEYSFGTWWSSPLHRQFLSVQANVDELKAKVLELRANYVTPAKIQTLLDSYKAQIRPFFSQDPDKHHLTELQWEAEVDGLIARLDEHFALYEGEEGVPMPFWTSATYNNQANSLLLRWEEAFDLEGDEILYDILVADNLEMLSPVLSINNIEGVREHLEEGIVLDPKSYYLRVIAKQKSEPSIYQIPFDLVITYDENGSEVYNFGYLKFEVE